MQPRAIAATIVALGLAFTIVVWMGRISQEPIVVDTAPVPKGPSEDEKPEVVKSGPKPIAVCDITDYDFGTMKLLSSGSHKFIIQNGGEGPLELKAGPTTCQCTIGELSAAIVAPGESTEVELKWTIKNPASWFEHSAEIWTNDADNSSITLKIGGFVGRDLIVKPEGSWSFGSITKIEEAKFEGWVLSDLHPEMELLSATIDSDIFSVELEKLTKEAILKRRQAGAFVDPSFPTKQPPLPSSGYRVVVKPVKEIPVGQFSHNLELTARMDDKVGEIKHHISIVGTKSGSVDFFALPGTTWVQNRMLLHAGTFSAEKGKMASLLMFVRGGDEEFKVTSLEKDLPWINVTTETKEKVGNADRVQVNIEFPADCPKTVRTTTMPATIRLKTNHPEAAEITINLSFISE
jgi:hypothetical protein